MKKVTKEKAAPVRSEKDAAAYELAELSCVVASTCNEKEHYFAGKFGVTPAEFKCLRLFLKESPITIKEISTNMDITPGRITHILTSLENKGFITRESSKQDRRNVFVHLTDKSKPFIKELNDGHLQLHKEIYEKIPKTKREEIFNSLRELVKVIKPFTKRK